MERGEELEELEGVIGIDLICSRGSFVSSCCLGIILDEQIKKVTGSIAGGFRSLLNEFGIFV